MVRVSIFCKKPCTRDMVVALLFAYGLVEVEIGKGRNLGGLFV